MSPTYLNIDFHRLCNSRCETCRIWAIEDPVSLELPYIEKFIRQAPDVKEVYVTGGEPYIHPDVLAIAAIVKDAWPDAVWHGNTNCISESTERCLAAIQDMGLALDATLSLEGDEEQHDRKRGTAGNYKRVMEVAAFLESRGIRYYYQSTCDEGTEEAKRLGKFCHQVPLRYGARFGGTEGEPTNKTIYDCIGGTHYLTLKPDGTVWPCDMTEEHPELCLGNIKTQDLSEMRFSEVRAIVKSGACTPCGMGCWHPCD